MKKSKRITALLLAPLLFAATSRLIVNANSLNDMADIKHDIQIENNMDLNEYSERFSNQVINESIHGSRGSASYRFSTSRSQPHYRVWIDNTTGTSMNVSVGGNSFNVPANRSISRVYTANSPGERTVNITSSDGRPLSGTIAVRVAQNLSDLD